MDPDTRFSQGTTRLMSWPDGSATNALCNPLKYLSLYFLYPLFAFLGLEAYFHRISLTHKSLDFHRGTCALSRHARSVLSRLCCNGHCLVLGSYFSRTNRIENPSCSACGHSFQDTSHLILHCPATDSLRRSLFGDSLSLYDLRFRLWELPGFWGFVVIRHAPIFQKGSGNNNNNARKELRKGLVV